MAAADRKITYTAAEVAELIRPLTQSVEALQKENAELKQKLEHMNEILANAQRARFGQSSEKKRYVLSEDQMSLFNEAEICQDSKAEEPTEETLTVKAHARKKKRTIDELAKNLPVEEIVIGLPESRLTCDKCGGTFKLIDMHETIVAERCERFRYCCIVGCQNDKRRVETSGGATGVGGTNPGMPQQRSLRKRMVPAARCYNNTPGKFLRHPSFFCGSSNPAK